MAKKAVTTRDKKVPRRKKMASQQRSKQPVKRVRSDPTAKAKAKRQKIIDRMREKVEPSIEVAVAAERPFVASPQQQAYFDWIDSGGNAFVEAVAGAGKTTTLLHGSELMKSKINYQWHSVAYCAFNRKIAKEVQGKLDALKAKGLCGYVRAGTFHSFGYAAWRRLHKDVKLDADEKEQAMLNVVNPPQHLRGIVCRLVSLAKNNAVMLDWQPTDRAAWQRIIDHHELDADVEKLEDMDKAVELACEGLEWSIRIADRLIDFDDQIFMPIITKPDDYPARDFIWRHNWVLVDEAQDTNPARRHLARRMMLPKWGRIVFVGDRHQAIYGFTGADADAVDKLMKGFHCKALPLTVTYRCPKLIVAEAQKYVKHIVAHESAPEGVVRSVNKKDFMKVDAPTLKPTDAILCRNTRPLVSLAFQLIRMGIPAHVEGRDIGKGLIALATRWRIDSTGKLRNRLEVFLASQVAKLTKLKKEAQIQTVTDKVETLYVIMEGTQTVAQVVAKIEGLFKEDEDGEANTVTLSTVHKAKGREWDRVFILGFNRYMPSHYARQPWQMEQENNLIYVAITRAQRELVYTEALEGEKKANA